MLIAADGRSPQPSSPSPEFGGELDADAFGEEKSADASSLADKGPQQEAQFVLRDWSI